MRSIQTPRAAVIGFAAMALMLVAAPARAHPWGPPPTAVITVDGANVAIEWQAQLDDAVALAVSLGLLHPTAGNWDWGAMNSTDRSAIGQALGSAPALHAYLLRNIQVLQGDVACEGEVSDGEDFLSGGTLLLYTCPHEVKALSVRITMLHALHEAYRTFAQIGGGARPPQQVFTVADPEHSWEFGDATTASTTPGTPGWELRAVTPALLLLAGVLGLMVRRRRRLARRHG